MTSIVTPPTRYVVETLCNEPRLMVLRGFLSESECDYLIAQAEAKIAPSTTVDPETGEHIRVEARSSSSTYFQLGQTDVIGVIEARIANQVNLPVVNGEGLQVLNYQIGQQYLPHFDFFDPAHKGSGVILACGGQRVATCIMYLNTVEPDAGGETHFPEVGIRVRPIKGDAVLFYNTLYSGEIDRLSLHASLPVTAGQKWVSTKWVREREYKSP